MATAVPRPAARSRSPALLVVLVVVLQLARPGIVTADWSGSTLRAAIPLAILAGCQTLCMLTGGIDLSVGAVGVDGGLRRWRRCATEQGPVVAIAIGLAAAALAGLVNGIGVGVFRVHPLIMTLGMGLVLLGPDSVYQLAMVQSPARRPRAHRAGSASEHDARPFLPNSLLVFIPIAALIISACAGAATAGCCSRSATTRSRRACRALASWQVLVALYIISALLAAHRRLPRRRPGQDARASSWSSRRCCRRWPPRSSAGPRSWAAAAAMPARSSGR